MFFLKFIFRDEGHLYANFCFFILPIYRKYLFFKFLTWDLRMHLAILTGVQLGRISGWKNGHILLKSVVLKLNFED